MSDRRRFAELLPFYVNGTLPQAEREWVADYMKRHPENAAELTFVRSLRDHFQQPLADTAAEAGLASLLGRLRRARHADQPSIWLRWVANPAFAAVAASLVLAQAVVIAYLLTDASTQEAATVRSAPATAPQGPTLKVIFRPDAEHGEILTLLRGLEGRIVAGPGPAGELWLAFPPAASPAEVAAALKRSQLVDDVADAAR